jgi:hypothetical protein
MIFVSTASAGFSADLEAAAIVVGKRNGTLAFS